MWWWPHASKAFRGDRRLANFSGTLISVTKGIEHQTGLTMCGILAANAPKAKFAALSGLTRTRSGPRHSTAIVAASEDSAVANEVQKLFHRPTFAFTPALILRAWNWGALKNIIAIAAGVCDGLGFGDNSKPPFARHR